MSLKYKPQLAGCGLRAVEGAGGDVAPPGDNNPLGHPAVPRPRGKPRNPAPYTLHLILIYIYIYTYLYLYIYIYISISISISISIYLSIYISIYIYIFIYVCIYVCIHKLFIAHPYLYNSETDESHREHPLDVYWQDLLQVRDLPLSLRVVYLSRHGWPWGLVN